MSNEIPVSDGGASTIPDLNTNMFEDSILGKMDDIFAEVAPLAVESQEEAVEEPISLEDSVVEELSPAEDETPPVELDESEESEVETAPVADEAELIYVDYDDYKDTARIPVKVNGKVEHLSLDQINAEVNRARTQDEARSEVETARAELEAKSASFEQDQYAFQQQQIASLGAQQMSALQAQAGEIQSQFQAAAEAGDTQEAMKLQAKLNGLQQSAQQVQQQMKEANANLEKARNEAAANAASELSKFGLGDLASDPQRVEAFQEYAMANVPQSVLNVVNTNAALLAMVEKARLYDKAHAEKPKAKLKGSTKTLKGAAAKPAAKKVVKSSIESKVDDMFS